MNWDVCHELFASACRKKKALAATSRPFQSSLPTTSQRFVMQEASMFHVKRLQYSMYILNLNERFRHNQLVVTQPIRARKR
jgi:hypothetical protein